MPSISKNIYIFGNYLWRIIKTKKEIRQSIRKLRNVGMSVKDTTKKAGAQLITNKIYKVIL
jgi:hypothetical protein